VKKEKLRYIIRKLIKEQTKPTLKLTKKPLKTNRPGKGCSDIKVQLCGSKGIENIQQLPCVNIKNQLPQVGDVLKADLDAINAPDEVYFTEAPPPLGWGEEEEDSSGCILTGYTGMCSFVPDLGLFGYGNITPVNATQWGIDEQTNPWASAPQLFPMSIMHFPGDNESMSGAGYCQDCNNWCFENDPIVLNSNGFWEYANCASSQGSPFDQPEPNDADIFGTGDNSWMQWWDPSNYWAPEGSHHVMGMWGDHPNPWNHSPQWPGGQDVTQEMLNLMGNNYPVIFTVPDGWSHPDFTPLPGSVDEGMIYEQEGPEGCIQAFNYGCNEQECCIESGCCCNGYFSDEPNSYIDGMCHPLCCGSNIPSQLSGERAWKVIEIVATIGGSTPITPNNYEKTLCPRNIPDFGKAPQKRGINESLKTRFQKLAGIK
jgi:hypothetical protein